LCEVEAVAAWADREENLIQAPLLFKLGPAAAATVHETLEVLHEVPGVADTHAVLREIARGLHQGLTSGDLTISFVGHAMYRLIAEESVLDDEFLAIAYYADAGVDLANNGVGDSLEAVDQHTRDLLARYIGA